eukprot:m.21614 g.21614  ORF g.21614 m.21614 type:complete len:196 (+) comp5368_c0_seq1:355-942(+)
MFNFFDDNELGVVFKNTMNKKESRGKKKGWGGSSMAEDNSFVGKESPSLVSLREKEREQAEDLLGSLLGDFLGGLLWLGGGGLLGGLLCLGGGGGLLWLGGLLGYLLDNLLDGFLRNFLLWLCRLWRELEALLHLEDGTLLDLALEAEVDASDGGVVANEVLDGGTAHSLSRLWLLELSDGLMNQLGDGWHGCLV